MELKILDFIQTLRNPILDKMMLFFTSLGNGGMIWLLLVVILICIPKTRKIGVMVMLALVLNVLLCSSLKHLFGRIRPCDVNTSIQLDQQIILSRPVIHLFHLALLLLYILRKKRSYGPSHLLLRY